MHLPSSTAMIQPSFPGPSFNVAGSLPHIGNVPPQMGNFAAFNSGSGFGHMSSNNANIPSNDAIKKNRDNAFSNNTGNAEKQLESKIGGILMYILISTFYLVIQFMFLDNITAGISRSITPISLSSRKSPTVDMAVQTGASKDRANKGLEGNKKPHMGYQRNVYQRQENNQGSYIDYRYINRVSVQKFYYVFRL